MRSSLFFLVAGAIGFACAKSEFDNLDGVAGCKDGACYTDFCPEAPIPTEATDEYNDKCANDKGSAGMLSAPGVRLVAGVVGVMAML
ncbi:hypothetical protein V498_01007 [Pseudogymnoascus sp. VKM F-4517 (FW-2822)]|nr:hypothetical protein V498_01007 [Pseudogymnoascus sp. VKM F-4517 (FW-2822)]